MYVPKYLKILEQEQIQENELTPELIREIKGMKMQVNVTKNLPEEDPKYQAMLAKDETICQMINAWLDEEVPEETPAAEEKPAQEAPPAEEKPAQEAPAQKPSVEEPPAEEKPAQEAPAAEEKPAEEAPKEETPAAEETPPANPDAQKIAAIREKLQKNRIHVNDLTQILGAKPNYPYHQLNGMRLERVFMNSQFYQVK